MSDERWTLWMDDSGQLRANLISPAWGGGGLVVVPLERAERAEQERDKLREAAQAVYDAAGNGEDAHADALVTLGLTLAALPDREEPR